MKKFISIVLIILVFLLIFLLQSNFFEWFTIAGVKPNLLVILVLFIGLYAGRKVGAFVGFTLGMILDCFINKTIGISAIMFLAIGFLGGYFDKNFDKEIKVTIILMVIGSTCIYEIGKYIFDIFTNNIMVEIGGFAKILCIEVLYNSIITIIFYPLLKKGGYYLENSFKTKQVLTRYF
ncbi:MAG: rod shape-determining protein MreD [Clostridia bacterium]|nr:rod shape-determining protein MreD [Clostridia bacterium]